MPAGGFKAPRGRESGLRPPEEWQINAHAGYASRFTSGRTLVPEGWKTVCGAVATDGLRGGVIVPLEGDRWHVTLIGIAGDYPPTD